MTVVAKHRKIMAYDENKKKIDGLHTDLNNAQLRFLVSCVSTWSGFEQFKLMEC